ncbi:MAG: hypothetical protein WC868_01720 [Bacteroidales bacterium]
MNTRKKLTKTLLVLFLCTNTSLIFAQDLSKEDSLANEISMIKSDIGILKKVKISGYVQAQFQVADSSGTKSYAGGDFPSNSDKRFMVRRGRIKIAYINTLSQYVMQFDVTEKGFATKDMYAQFTEPWLSSFSIKAGIYNRPFGYEIPFSSSMRESPERGRMSQIIFPGERDLGASIVFNPPKTSRFNFFTLEAGMFNGTGIASDFDKEKDFIGHLVIAKSKKNEKIKYGLGVSYYNGGWREGTTTYYEGIETLSSGVKAFKKVTGKVGVIAKREYMGADAQLSIETPFGMTTLRGEFIMGTQPGTSSSSASPSAQPTGSSTTNIAGTATGTINIPANSGDTTITVTLPVTGTVTTTAPNADTYIRKFNGAYFYFCQNIGNTKHQLVLKYDWYDPNTEVKGSEIDVTGVTSANGKLSSTDIKYTTIGIGWIYHWDENVKIMAYYDIVKNEKTKISKYTNDLLDNVFTLRIQYKF